MERSLPPAARTTRKFHRGRPAKLPIWLGVGGNPESALRAGELGLPVILANISQPPANFASQIAAYRQRHAERGHDASTRKVAIATHTSRGEGFADRPRRVLPALQRLFPRTRAARQPRRRSPARRLRESAPAATGPIFVGSPQQIIDKLMYERELFGHDRFLAQVDIGGLPYAKVANAIELLATQVLPAISRLSPVGVNQVC